MSVNRTYIHYPFCTKLCHYCNFSAGVAPQSNFINDYFKALIKELNFYKNNYNFQEIAEKSLYLGGGTPSLMPLDQLETILHYFSFNKNTEITLEINPETVTKEKAKIWFDLGINRVSLGWQTMNAGTLKFLGRTSTPKDNIRAFEILRETGFNNISVDRILSVQNDTEQEFLQAVEKCKPDHISTYQLSIEDKTVLSLWTKQKKYLPILDEQAITIESSVEDILCNLGYQRYETSNYALKNKEGQHNLGYWNYEYWLGLGAGASGFLPDDSYGLHYSNHFSFNNYCNDPIGFESSEHIDFITAIKEYLMLGVRKRSGISKPFLENKFNISWDDLFAKKINLNYFIETENNLILKKEMIPLSNPAILELWDCIHPQIQN